MEPLPTDSVAFHLLSDPAVNTSSKHEVTARVIDGAEDIRTLIGWSRDINKILAGLNLSQDAQFNQAMRITSSMMRGRVTSTFNRELSRLFDFMLEQIKPMKTKVAMPPPKMLQSKMSSTKDG